ncbi:MULTISPECIES: zinc-binding metallopeptidase family protein [Luteimonas]|uniref:zinc-binding metallopeptidase family protein n=1 Tax=Luteimonas TaxID=83614 RepID=UPI000C7B0599|nr:MULTISPECIES: putative zinc-binding peptidase [Luteimonas]
MQLFKCQHCDQVVYFENTACTRCNSRLGYLPDLAQLSAVTPDGGNWIAHADPGPRYRFCRNWELNACNWMLPAGDGETYCRACRHNRTIPNLAEADNREHWRKIETAKRRLFYTLLRLRLPMPTAASGDPEPLEFDFLADQPGAKKKVITGHASGLITIALTEADDATREAARVRMGEPYRTLLGHFRHEVGHYYWDKLVRDGGDEELARYRDLFGDERASYADALTRHYENGAPDDWQQAFVSSYATMHPWEDWAETWAHYLHIVDTLEMAAAFGIRIDPDITDDDAMTTEIGFDPHRVADIQRLIDAWLPLTYAVNSLNRAMGQPDLYPFVIRKPVVDKMAYIHGLIRRARRAL